MEVDWIEIEIPFNIAQVEASAANDVAIKRGKSDDVIADPIWQTGFNATGSTISPANPDDAIADKIKGSWFGWGAREFKYKYKIASWPSGTTPSWNPKVKYSWEILSTSQSGNGELTGWEKDFKVTLPTEVGKYDLKVVLKIYFEDELLRTETRTHTLYVVYDSPIGTTTVSGGASVATGQPRTAWLDIALDWASGQSTSVNILNALNSAEYGGGSSPLGWEYGYPKVDPVTLIENGSGKNGDCFVFRDVWRIFASSMGIGTSFSDYTPLGGFMTSTRPALDGNASANARNKTTMNRDRWFFGNHQFGTYGGTFYDPTFGLTGANTTTGKEGNVFCKITSGLTCTVLSPPPARAELAPTAASVNGWSIVQYETFATRRAAVSSPTTSAAAVGTGTFTGNVSDVGYDDDGNGLYEQLQIDVEVDVSIAGDFGVVGALLDGGGNLIALASLDPSLLANAPVFSVSLDTGVHTLSLFFNGAAIRRSGVDGPFTVNVELVDEIGTALDSTSFATNAFEHTAFEGLLAEVQTVSDSGVDIDALPGYNLLQVTVVLNGLAAGDVVVQGQLFAGSVYLSDVAQTVSLTLGPQQIHLDFPGEAIAAGGLDGPYTVYLSLSDGFYSYSEEYTTATYSFLEFQPPSALFTGNVSDSASDTNGNGLYETLNVAVETVALIPGNYTVQGILQDGSGGFIQTVEETVALDDTPQDVILRFNGRLIYQNSLDGPFQVQLALIDAAGSDLISLDFATSVYPFSSFEHPEALFNGSFADTGVDHDGDGLYNLLRIDIGIEVLEARLYQIEGSLHDSSGDFITFAQVEQFLSAGTHTVSLIFDGAILNGHGVDGPYRLLGLEIRESSGGAIDTILDAYQTAAYAYGEFQPIGMSLTGAFSDYGDDTNGNGLFEALVVTLGLVVDQSESYTSR